MRSVGVVVALSAVAVPVTGGAATLAGGSRQGAVSMAVIPTGHLGDPSNRFFQTFTSTGGAWSLSTPRGTATNGGIIIASPEAGAVSVLAFDASHVSVIQGLMAGQPSRAGNVVSAILAQPTALTVNPVSGQMAAISASGGVLMARHRLSPMRPFLSARQLAASPAGRQCGFSAATSAAVMTDGTMVVGGRCSRPGYSGLLERHPGRGWMANRIGGSRLWHAVRVDPTVSGSVALAQSGGSHPVLRMGTIGSRGITWSEPARVGADLRSIAVTSLAAQGSSYVVASVTGNRVQAWRLGASAPARRIGPALSSKVQAVVDGASGSVHAFAVDGRRVVISGLRRGEHRWVVETRRVLPLPYGTSS